MRILIEKNDVFCAVLENTEEDFTLFQEVSTACYHDQKEPEVSKQTKSHILSKIEKTQGEHWRTAFNIASHKNFVLLERTPHEGHTVVGQAELFLPADPETKQITKALFTDVHVRSPYQGKQLSDLLYTGRMRYVAEHAPHIPQVKASIMHHKIYQNDPPAIVAVLRNGFQEAAEQASPRSEGVLRVFIRPMADFKNEQGLDL